MSQIQKHTCGIKDFGVPTSSISTYFKLPLNELRAGIPEAFEEYSQELAQDKAHSLFRKYRSPKAAPDSSSFSKKRQEPLHSSNGGLFEGAAPLNSDGLPAETVAHAGNAAA
jgi:hypothetical protein